MLKNVGLSPNEGSTIPHQLFFIFQISLIRQQIAKTEKVTAIIKLLGGRYIANIKTAIDIKEANNNTAVKTITFLSAFKTIENNNNRM